LDANQDAKLTAKDAPEGPRAPSLRQLIHRADQDKDGAVTLAEFIEIRTRGPSTKQPCLILAR
jgi:hypothetical protein